MLHIFFIKLCFTSIWSITLCQQIRVLYGNTGYIVISNATYPGPLIAIQLQTSNVLLPDSTERQIFDSGSHYIKIYAYSQTFPPPHWDHDLQAQSRHLWGKSLYDLWPPQCPDHNHNHQHKHSPQPSSQQDKVKEQWFVTAPLCTLWPIHYLYNI